MDNISLIHELNIPHHNVSFQFYQRYHNLIYDLQDEGEIEDLRKKINPMLGITCQHQFYEDSITDMRDGKITEEELVSKLFNVYR